jgi:hypothetical protein
MQPFALRERRPSLAIAAQPAPGRWLDSSRRWRPKTREWLDRSRILPQTATNGAIRASGAPKTGKWLDPSLHP